MTKQLVVILLALILSAPWGWAQTRVKAFNLAGETSTSGRLLVVLPDGRIAEADLDGVALDTSGVRPVLRSSAAPVPVRQKIKIVLTSATGTLGVPGKVADVYRNGLLLAEGDDYALSVSGDRTTITFTAGQTPQAGDIVQVR